MYAFLEPHFYLGCYWYRLNHLVSIIMNMHLPSKIQYYVLHQTQ